MARTPGANTPGKRLIFTDMDLEDESPRPEQSRENSEVVNKSSDTDDSDAEFTVNVWESSSEGQITAPAR